MKFPRDTSTFVKADERRKEIAALKDGIGTYNDYTENKYAEIFFIFLRFFSR